MSDEIDDVFNQAHVELIIKLIARERVLTELQNALTKKDPVEPFIVIDDTTEFDVVRESEIKNFDPELIARGVKFTAKSILQELWEDTITELKQHGFNTVQFEGEDDQTEI